VNNPTGILSGPTRTTVIQAQGQMTNADDFRRQIIAWRNGAPVRLGDVANVMDSVENDKVASATNGIPGVILAIRRQPGANTIEVVDAIRKILPSFQASLPAAMTLSIHY